MFLAIDNVLYKIFTFCCIPFTDMQDMLWIEVGGTVIAGYELSQNKQKRYSPQAKSYLILFILAKFWLLR